MPEHHWFKEFPGAIIVTDTEGIILEMNDAAEEVFKDDGGRALIGKNVLDCHPDAARGQLERMMETQTPNVYTIVTKDRKKLIFQTPWYKDGQYAGFIELSLEIPLDVPHFARD